MDTKKINFGFPTKLLSAFSLVLLATNLLIACSNGGGGGNNVVPVPPCMNCQQGIVTGQTLIVAPSVSPLQGEWILSGDANIISQMQMAYGNSPLGPKIYNIYQGPLFLSGNIAVANLAAFSRTCFQLQQMGNTGFSFNSIMPGNADRGSFEVRNVQASSAIGNFTFDVIRGILYNGNFSATLIVTSVNGMQCQSFPISVF